jgi:predicted enzyme related to lactoylglutathione lyase
MTRSPDPSAAHLERPTYLDARPTIEVADLAAALAFWTDVLGFDVMVTMGEPPSFAIVSSGDAVLGLVEADEPTIPEGAPVYITLSGLDALVARLEQASISLAVPITTRPWGLRDLVVACPGGGPLIALGEEVAR